MRLDETGQAGIRTHGEGGEGMLSLVMILIAVACIFGAIAFIRESI